MSENSKIEWTDHTFNPWIGCTKVSPGCVNCYAETRSKHTDGVQWGKDKPRRRTSAANWKLPLKWDRDSEANFRDCANEGKLVVARCYRRPRVFCASLADWLDDEVPTQWRAELLQLIFRTPNLDWLLLTKRPENWERLLNKAADWIGCGETPMDWQETLIEIDTWLGNPQMPPTNVWIGTSVEDQKRADERIPKLLEIPAKVRFLSCEPLLGVIDLHLTRFDRIVGSNLAKSAVDWVIIGGESGPKARSCDVQWVRSLVAQGQSAGVPAFVKQLGARAYGPDVHSAILHDRKGGDVSEWPEDLRVREFPITASVSSAQSVVKKSPC